MADPTPADALSSLARGTEEVKAELGDKKELFALNHFPLENYYVNSTGEWIEQEGCVVHRFDVTIANAALAGKTLKIKTYAYGDMAYGYCMGGENGEGYVAINPDANITENPESGVCEFEVTLPSADWMANQSFNFLEVSFCENPYTEFGIYEKKGSVWEEIKVLESRSGVLASGDSNGWHYRKWTDGTAECWRYFYGDGTTYEASEEGDIVYVYIPLPFMMPTKYATIVQVNPQCMNSNGTFAGYSTLTYAEPYSDSILVEVRNPSGYTKVRCYIYTTGNWKEEP